MDRKIGEPAIPGTEADAMELEEINRVYDFGLPIVQELRNNPDYVESDVYQNYTDEEKAHRLTSGPLAGSRALALQVGFFIPSWLVSKMLQFATCPEEIAGG